MFKCTRLRELEKLKLVLGVTTSKYIQEFIFEVKIWRISSHDSLLLSWTQGGVAARLGVMKSIKSTSSKVKSAITQQQ